MRAKTAPDHPSAPIAATFTATSMKGTIAPCPAVASQVSAGYPMRISR
ncbi:MAG: hypothetical protein JO345_38485 [Streptosporangiaceae bacterium]|nr:hypothetical protein [Streptosporangiaceae bacterium]